MAGKEKIIRKMKDSAAELIRMQFTDIFGQLKNVVDDVQLEKAKRIEYMRVIRFLHNYRENPNPFFGKKGFGLYRFAHVGSI